MDKAGAARRYRPTGWHDKNPPAQTVRRWASSEIYRVFIYESQGLGQTAGRRGLAAAEPRLL
jgi:hypothetical protein